MDSTRNFSSCPRFIPEETEYRQYRDPRVKFNDVEKIYANLSTSSNLGVVIEYSPLEESEIEKKSIVIHSQLDNNAKINVGFIGVGNYGSRVLIPKFKNAGCNPYMIVGKGGLSATYNAWRHGATMAGSDYSDILSNPSINLVTISTPHNLHAQQVCEALSADKHVFVEKPLALNLEEIADIKDAYQSSNKILMVGFNRRFSPLIKSMKEILDNTVAPKFFKLDMNAGYIPREHWVQNPKIGGGRIIGEVCHYIDLVHYLTGSHVKRLSSFCIHSQEAGPVPDNVAILLSLICGSLATINYFSNGAKTEKE